MHADLWNAWNPKVQADLVQTCLNGKRDCTKMKASEFEGFGSAMPTATGTQNQSAPSASATAVHAHKDATPIATPVSSATTLPETGPIGAIAVAGTGAVSYVWLQHRRSRRSIRHMIMRHTKHS